jgi:uncharacterized membrane protein (DUF4010 family)
MPEGKLGKGRRARHNHNVDLNALTDLATALFIGALIGTERTQRQVQEEPHSFAGLRTFCLLSLLGAVVGWLSQRLSSPWVLGAGLAGVVALVIAARLSATGPEGRAKDPGMTTEVAAVMVFVLGAIAVLGARLLAVSVAIASAALLATKDLLHRSVERVSRVELLATLRLLFASFIVLPLLPRHAVDPWGALVPQKLWMLVVLISALSLLGYVAVRIWGDTRGILLTGLFGGIVSSTAVTLTFAKQSREPGANLGSLAAGTLLAWTVMFLRVVILVGALAGVLLVPAARALGVMGTAAMMAGVTLVLQRTKPRDGDARRIELNNPFSLTSAMKFAALFAAVLLAARFTQMQYPRSGILWLSALAGSTDVDAIALSLVQLLDTGLTIRQAVVGLVVAAMANTAVKLGLILFLGSRQLALRLVPAAAAIIVAGGLVLIW